MDEKIKRLHSWSKGIKQPPLTLELGLSMKCNLNCLFCWRQDKNKKVSEKELTTEEYIRIIDGAAKLGVKEVRIIGEGESTLRKDILDIMSVIKKKKMEGFLYTNGTLLNKEILSNIVDIEWDYVKFSLNGPNKKIHDALTNYNGSFKEEIKNVIFLQKIKQESLKDKPKIEISVVLNDYNYKYLKKIVNLAKKINANEFFVEPVSANSSVSLKLKLKKKNDKKLQKVLKKGIDLCNKYKLNNNLDSILNNKSIYLTNSMHSLILKGLDKDNNFFSIPCYHPWHTISIRANGQVGFCGFFDESNKENILNNSLKDIWYGKWFNEQRKKMLNKKIYKKCSNCCLVLAMQNQMARKMMVELQKGLNK